MTREKDVAMTADEAPVENGAAASGKARSLPFDTSVAHQARMYDYLLGGCFL
jgi:hypothetical protein